MAASGEDIGVSIAESSSATNSAPFSVTGGGGKTTSYLFVAIAAIAAIAIAVILTHRSK